MPEFDKHLGCWVKNENHARDIAKERGLIDIREFAENGKEIEVIERIAEENRKANMHATYNGYDEAVARALEIAERGGDFEKQLADEIREADRKNDANRVPLEREGERRRGS